MYGYVYKTTNLINNTIYIGLHCSKTFDTNYLGSGSYFKRALKKYGKENFKCEIIEECNDYLELNEKEIFWIKYYIELGYEMGKTLYNLKISAIGGDTYTYAPLEHRLEHKRKLSKSLSGLKHTQETKNNISKAHKGKKHSKEWVENNIKSKKATHKHWYTNGLPGNDNNKLISEGDPIPEGFYVGRTYSDELKLLIKEKTNEGNKNHNKQVWNKGLTKDSDSRVAAYGLKHHLNYQNKK